MLERYTIQISTDLFKLIICSKNYFIKDTRTRQTYSGRKWRATGYGYLNVSLYRDDEGLSQLRLCLHDAIINAALRKGGKLTHSNCIDSVHLEGWRNHK